MSKHKNMHTSNSTITVSDIHRYEHGIVFGAVSSTYGNPDTLMFNDPEVVSITPVKGVLEIVYIQRCNAFRTSAFDKVYKEIWGESGGDGVKLIEVISGRVCPDGVSFEFER